MPNEIRLNPVIAIAAVHPTTRPARVSRAQQRWGPSRPSAAIPAMMTSTTSPFIWTSVALQATAPVESTNGSGSRLVARGYANLGRTAG